jgi:hypothetical protein
MKMTLILAGLLGLSLLVGCAIVPLEPFGVYGHGHGGYYGYDRGGGHGHYDRGHHHGYYGGGPGYYR